MRALPADSLEYFGDTAEGKTALAAGTGAVAGAATGFVAGVAAGFAAGTGGAAGTGAADVSVAHSAFRKSFHFMPLSVPAVWAALYLALHSCIVSA